MNELLTNTGSLIGIAYTIALLGHILHKGFIAETIEERFARRAKK